MTIPFQLSVAGTLPADAADGTFLGRIWHPALNGPAIVTLRGDDVVDISASFPTSSHVFASADPTRLVAEAEGQRVCSLADLLANTVPDGRDDTKPFLLAPVDLQAIKAAGVTFVVSMLERVIEERARGSAADAILIREEVGRLVGDDLADLRPGSPEAEALKALLIEKGMWSQYLEVGIGPDAEIFTKTTPMASIGTGMEAGLHPKSAWNNPEPEVVLAVSPQGKIVGASLGNDVNLRDFEGRSALLLSKAKDNNASCVIGPFIRLFDASFSLDDVRAQTVSLLVEGQDGFRMEGGSSISKISRDLEDLVAQAMGETHQYPDGMVLFTGTMFAPITDRDGPGQGFTHHVGDIVTVSAPKLGSIVNRMNTSDKCAPWTFGTRALLDFLVKQQLAAKA